VKAASFVSRIICFLVIFTLFVSVDGHRAEAAYTYQGKVNVDTLNVRSNAGTSYAIIGKLKKGQVVTVYENRQGWSKIASGKRYGWVSSPLLTHVTWTGHVVNASNLNVRQSPAATAKILTKVRTGTAVTVHGTNGSWLKVFIPSKKITGWVHATYISKQKPAATATVSKPVTTVTVSKPATWTGYVTGTNLNVRSAASATATVVTRIGKNTEVTVQDKSGSWLKVYIPSKKVTGWVHSDYISKTKPVTTVAVSKPAIWTGYVTGTNLNVRSAASATAKVVTQIGKNTEVTVQDKSGSWLKVYIPSKKVTGWIHSDYISNKPAASAPKVTTASTTTATTQTQVVLLGNSHFRTGPGTSHSSISVEKAGTLLTKIGESNGWVQARKADGVTGWVAGWLVGPAPSSPLKGKTIVVDPGHGGIDTGAIGRLYMEKRLNLSASLELGRLLQNAGAKVIYTRSSDIFISLTQRVAISNQSNADAFISVHYNSCSGVCSGIETFYYNYAKDNAMARSIQSNLIKSTQLRDRGTRYGNYQVIRYNQRPAALVELGFLSNPTEESLVGTSAGQKKAVQGIYNGLVAFFK
jgi:N-acetylmuramoyl-L-alanine amidase